jgi:hypothetical protein
VLEYRRRIETLEEMILGGLYTACGQVPRAPELLILEYENGFSTERGISHGYRICKMGVLYDYSDTHLAGLIYFPVEKYVKIG